MMQVGSKLGMRTMKDAAYALLEEGIITSEVAKTLLATSSSDVESGDNNASGAAKQGAKGQAKFGSGF